MKSFLQHLQERSLLAPMMLSAALGAGAPPEAPKPIEQPVQQTVKTKNKLETPKKPAWHSLISGSEGMKTDAYWDGTGKVWTIGKGSTTHPDGRPVKRGDRITPDQADQYMEHYVNKNLVPKLEKIPTWGKMSENQKGALVSFGFELDLLIQVNLPVLGSMKITNNTINPITLAIIQIKAFLKLSIQLKMNI